MFEFKIHRRTFTIAIAILVLGFAFSGRTQVAHANGDTGHVATIQQSGEAGHQLVAFFGMGSTSGCGKMVMTNGRPTMGHGMSFSASTTGNGAGRQMVMWRNDERQQIAMANDNSTTGNLMVALMRPETWHMDGTSGGHGHRLSAARMKGGHQVIAMAPRPTYGHNLRT